MSDYRLEVNTRTVIGKQVAQLRRAGLVPGIIYGAKVEAPIAMQVEWTALRPVLLRAGGTELINLDVDGQKVDVLVREVHRHPVRGDVLHIDFQAVDITKTLHTTVPISLEGVESTSRRLNATIFQPLTHIDVESLPGNIPSHIEVDVTVLEEVGQNLTVADLPQLEGVVYLAEEDAVVARSVAVVEIEEEELDDEALDADDVEVISRGKDEDEEGDDEA